ncbi:MULTISPECIES: 30S ribosomal protein S16 [Anaerolinea]|uniref:Small ribosomal subunit protein bS16 n=1 Tax=Anaerolinea thermophila (strain DSM 14523 / JCM 11388 / NBRC 100420 / UNI-1) TaxID=926569 RepID=E8N5B6_ANATU|nr:30S ribosomal protein S16 [Anaerolinea thermophila UNI-1]
MVRIRLRRTGLKKQPTYRVVVANSEAPRDGRFIEILGHYNPRTEPFTLEVDEDRVYYWMSVGAQPSEAVLKLFKSTGIMDRFARFKNGEPKEKLLEEARAYFATRGTNPKTRLAS